MSAVSSDMRPAGAADLEAMLDTLVPAFAGDPVWGTYAFPRVEHADRQRRGLFRLWLQWALPHGALRVTPGCEAVAGWYAPTGAQGSAEEERQLRAFAEAELGMEAPAVLGICERLETAHPLSEPHYYLSLLGVAAAHRGRGLGLALLRASLSEIDAAGRPAYLESTNPRNLPLYEGLGFRRIGRIALPRGGAIVDQMWRAARS